jgi:hypothetical protein
MLKAFAQIRAHGFFTHGRQFAAPQQCFDPRYFAADWRFCSNPRRFTQRLASIHNFYRNTAEFVLTALMRFWRGTRWRVE